MKTREIHPFVLTLVRTKRIMENLKPGWRAAAVISRMCPLYFDIIQLNHTLGLRIITYGLVIYGDSPTFPALLAPTVSRVQSSLPVVR